MTELVTLTIDSEPEWKKWYRGIENGTYVISHDINKWHSEGRYCKLGTRIHKKLYKWKGSKCVIRHNPTKEELWVTVKLSDNYCECGKLIKEDKVRCMPCAVSYTKTSKPFYDNYQIREITVLTQDFEYVYRLFKYMASTVKLIAHHLDCDSMPQTKRCEHIRSFLNRNQHRLPRYSSRVRGTKIEVVKLLQ